MDDKNIEDGLKESGKSTPEYPKDKFTATRAEFVTGIRTHNRDVTRARIRWGILLIILGLLCLFGDKILDLFR